MEIPTTDLLTWIPKSVLLGVLVALCYFCTSIIKYVIRTKHKEIMEKFVHTDRHLLQIRDSVMQLNAKIDDMVTIEQLKETKSELREYIGEVKCRFEDELKSIKNRITLIEGR